MAWLLPKSFSETKTLEHWLNSFCEKLQDPSTERSALVREELALLLYAKPYSDLLEVSPLAALALDAENMSLEAEYYTATDPELFAKVKPLLWFWKILDLTPLGQSVHTGVLIRQALAPFIFKRVGKNFKCFQNVEFSVGYNLEVGDNVTLHRYAFLDDIGGLVLGDNASVSDYVNIYSHTHHILDSPNVTLKQTIIGSGVRITYHATVLAGVRIGDDAMIGTGALVTKDIPPHAVALGIPAKPKQFKSRPDCPYCLSGQPHSFELVPRLPHRKPNPDFPDF